MELSPKMVAKAADATYQTRLSLGRQACFFHTGNV